MEQSKQLVSIELAEKMDKLGFDVPCRYIWADMGDGRSHQLSDTLSHGSTITTGKGERETRDYWAYGIAELGEMLPKFCWFAQNPPAGNWKVTYIEKSHDEFAETEADARAKMLIWLAEQKLINPREIKI